MIIKSEIFVDPPTAQTQALRVEEHVSKTVSGKG